MKIVLRERRLKKHSEAFAPPITDINVTPLVDICLVLVIIFLVFAPLMYLSGITVTRAKASKNQEQYDPTELKVGVYLRGDGKIILNEKEIDEKNLPYLIEQLLLRSLNRTVTISADPNVKHGKVVWLLDLARQKGAVTLCILKRKGVGTATTTE
ncbi:MAG: biopolymer transporter ExbD [bacterium]|nr:biopolymer transporter ExbD [bacterium]